MRERRSAPELVSMHELAATQGILTVALDAARDAGADRVTAIDVIVGDLSSMVGDSLQFIFDVLSRDTPAAGATLRLRRVAAVATCKLCGASYDVSPPLNATCAVCSGDGLAITGGREFYVESIEVGE
jgi:hydrogenase nickel incorporation protein HypA/HybF